jgi:hypothetical protein
MVNDAFNASVPKQTLAFNYMQHVGQRMRKATSKVDYVEALAH